jgi:hypothetical protein
MHGSQPTPRTRRPTHVGMLLPQSQSQPRGNNLDRSPYLPPPSLPDHAGDTDAFWEKDSRRITLVALLPKRQDRSVDFQDQHGPARIDKSHKAPVLGATQVRDRRNSLLQRRHRRRIKRWRRPLTLTLTLTWALGLGLGQIVQGLIEKIPIHRPKSSRHPTTAGKNILNQGLAQRLGPVSHILGLPRSIELGHDDQTARLESHRLPRRCRLAPHGRAVSRLKIRRAPAKIGPP